MAMNHRDVGSLGAEGAIVPPDFGRSVYPILMRGALQPKPLFWFRSDTETKTKIGQFFWSIL